MTDYNIAPETWDHTKAVCKRYNLSEYKRLCETDARFLWRVTHPVMDERISRLQSTAEFYRAERDLKKNERKHSNPTRH